MTPNQFTYHCYLAHRTLRHGDRPTKAHLRVARVLARWQHRSPSHAKLARAAHVCRRTVINALNRFRWLGLLDWVHQGFTSRFDGRRRLPNRYSFMATFLLCPPPKKESVKSTTPKLLLCKLRNQPWDGRPMLPIRTVAQQLAMLLSG